MPILALGISYRRAPVELLERLAFLPDDDPKAYRQVLEPASVAEAVILSTCNRVEVFAEVDSYHAGFQDLKRFLSESREVPADDFAEPMYAHYETHAVEHLFSVAAGIDSVVVGEPQILAQVRQAHRRAEAESATGPVLGRLFRAAVRAGKRARAETAIGESARGFVEAGTDLAERELGGLAGRPAAVVGAGAMAGLAAAHLRDRGMGPIRIVNRSPERAQRLATRTGGEAAPFARLAHAVADADVVVSSTGATGTVIGPSVVHESLRLGGDRSARPLFLLDLAVPRDVDPAVEATPGVIVTDLDDIKEALRDRSGGQGPQAGEIERVQEIVAQEVDRFESWRRAARLAPLIQALRDRGERALAAELARFAPRLATLGEPERQAVEALARGVVAKLLHDPIVRLKEPSAPGTGDARARVLAELFGLPFPPGAPPS
jgi:glutamyl-tRNA reductase